MRLKPKNWVHFQHYKDRCPPWIKLHRDLLNNRDFMRLPLASKALAPMLWLLASESKDGSFDGSLDEIVFRLHISEKDYQDGLKPLLDKGFFISDSDMLAPCLQDATPERETETETKREKKTAYAVAPIVAAPDGVSQSTWESFVRQRKTKKAQITPLVLDGIKREAEIAGWPLEQALREVVIRNWQSFKAEWVAKPQLANKADVAHATAPPPPNQDAALKKIEEDRKKAVPIPDNIREKIAELKKAKA